MSSSVDRKISKSVDFDDQIIDCYPGRIGDTEKEWENMYEDWGSFVDSFESPKTPCTKGVVDFKMCSLEYPCMSEERCYTYNGEQSVRLPVKAIHPIDYKRFSD